ncbi:MAG: hypothetical protein L3J61_04115 [Ghiorsea sp.]|nr:hypothetical protein [Ghiorsea sp.]
MSDKRPDERNIDEILASIDEMLSQKEPYSLQPDTRKDAVKEAAKASEDTLGLSSSVDTPVLSEFDHIDIDEFLSLGMQGNQPAVETKIEEHMAEEHKTEVQAETNPKPKADIVQDTDQDVVQEIDEDINFTLDETDFPDFDEPHSSNQEENADEQAAQTSEINDNDDMPPSPEKPQEPVDTHTDDLVHDDLIEDDLIEDDLDEAELDETELVQDDKPVAEDNTPRHRILLTEELLEPSAQEALPLWVEQAVPEEETTEAEHAPNEDKATEAQAIEPEKVEEEQTAVSETEADTLKNNSEKPSDTEPTSEAKEHIENTDAVADTTKDDASIFDLEEGIGLDTVYKLETITSGADDDLDNHTELVEVMMEEVLQDDEEQPQNSEDEPEKAIEKVFLSDDEMQNMVQAVSADVAQQINDHLQTWLPGLISIAIKNHIKDLNNKD